MTRRLPTFAILLGLAGLLPFAACSLGALSLEPDQADRALLALVAYGATILAFLGGVHWGFALDGSGTPTVRVQRLRFGLGVGAVPGRLGRTAGDVRGLPDGRRAGPDRRHGGDDAGGGPRDPARADARRLHAAALGAVGGGPGVPGRGVPGAGNGRANRPVDQGCRAEKRSAFRQLQAPRWAMAECASLFRPTILAGHSYPG